MTVQTSTGFVGLGVNASLKDVIAFVNRLLIGRLNVCQDFTLAAGAGSSKVTDSRIGASTAIIPVPLTANAAAELGNGTLFIPTATMAKGSAVIQHANNVQTDRTFRLVLLD